MYALDSKIFMAEEWTRDPAETTNILLETWVLIQYKDVLPG